MSRIGGGGGGGGGGVALTFDRRIISSLQSPYVSNLITPPNAVKVYTYILISRIQHNTSTSFNEHAFFKLALILEGRVQDPIQPSCTKAGGKASLFVRPRHAENRIDEPLLSPNFLSSRKTQVYFMNNRCML